MGGDAIKGGGKESSLISFSSSFIISLHLIKRVK